MDKMKNWMMHPLGDIWFHSEKQVLVIVELLEGEFSHGNLYHAFAWGVVPSNTMGADLFAIRSDRACCEVKIVEGVSHEDARKSAILWMRTHPCGGICAAMNGRHW